MKRTQSTVFDELTISLEFRRHGWSGLHFISNGSTYSLRISGVFTDPEWALLDLCDAILANSSLRVALCDEPGGHILQIEPLPKLRHVMAFSVFEVCEPLAPIDADQDGELRLSHHLKRQQLLGMLMSELWKEHVFLKEPSYQKGRDGFPHQRLIEFNQKWDISDLGPSFLK